MEQLVLKPYLYGIHVPRQSDLTSSAASCESPWGNLPMAHLKYGPGECPPAEFHSKEICFTLLKEAKHSEGIQLADLFWK